MGGVADRVEVSDGEANTWGGPAGLAGDVGGGTDAFLAMESDVSALRSRPFRPFFSGSGEDATGVCARGEERDAVGVLMALAIGPAWRGMTALMVGVEARGTAGVVEAAGVGVTRGLGDSVRVT